MRKMLGFFFAVILMLLIFVTIYIQKWNPFQKLMPIQVQFERVEGLRKGDDVRVEGVLFGKVSDLELADGGVLVHINLDRPVNLYSNYDISVEAFTILGGNFVSIKRGDPTAGKADLSKVLKGRNKLSAFDEIGTAIAENRDSIKTLIADTGAAFREIKETVTNINQGKGTIGRLATSPEMHDSLIAAVDGAKKATDDIRKVMGDLGDSLNRTDTTVGKMLNTNEMHDAWITTMEEVRQGMDKAVNQIEAFAKRFDEAKGPIPALIHDEKMREDLKATADHLRKISENVERITDKVAKGEGTVGKLITEDKLYQDAEKALQGVDNVLGRAARSKVLVTGELKDYPDSKEMVSRIGLKIAPDDTKYFYGGAAFLSLDAKGPLRFEKQVEENENDTLIKPEIWAMYRIPWFVTDYVGVKAGLIEGKMGMGVELDFNLFEGYPLHVDFEIRDAYNDLDEEKFDEEIGGPMTHLWARVPMWPEGNTWYAQLFHAIKIFGGVSRLQDDPEFIAGIGLEYRDEDIKALVGLLSAAR